MTGCLVVSKPTLIVMHILLSLCSSQKSPLNQRSLFYWRHLLFPELLPSPIREGGATWNFILLEIQTFKDVFIKCKILIFFYFSKMQQKCFMLDTIQPFAESINPDGKKESHPNTSVSFYSYVKVLFSPPQMSSVFSFCCSFKNKLKSLRKKLRRIRG